MGKSNLAGFAVIIFSSLLLAGALFFINETNSKKDYEITFSKEGGFYEDAFFLELQASSKVKIYYTLDGSEPTKSSLLYTEPIEISDASQNDNIWCMSTDVSTGFLDDYIEEYCPDYDPGYTVPNFKVDKCTVIRAVAIDSTGHTGDIYTKNYFVGFADKVGYDNVRFVCINCDPAEFFGYKSGIYVTGKEFDNYLVSDQWIIDKNERRDSWENWYCNYSSGKNADVNVQCFDQDGKLIFDEAAIATIKGETSVAYNPKSLRIKFDAGRPDVFEDGKHLDGFCLEACGQDNIILLRDKIVNDLCKDTHIVTRDYIPCVLFLDGEYWGYYYISQLTDKNFFDQYYNCTAGDVVYMEDRRINVGNADDMTAYQEAVNYIKTNDMSVKANYDQACQYIDMDSFIDYYAVEYIIANCDWSEFQNYGAWQTRTPQYKWNYVLFDLNTATMECKLASTTPQEFLRYDDTIFGHLSRNSEFSNQFDYTVSELLENQLSYASVSSYIEDYKEKHLENLKLNQRRFYNSTREEEIEKELEEVQEFFREREKVRNWPE